MSLPPSPPPHPLTMVCIIFFNAFPEAKYENSHLMIFKAAWVTIPYPLQEMKNTCGPGRKEEKKK